MSHHPTSPQAKKPVSRRAVVTAAAWTAPVIATGIAAPFAAASCGSPDSREFGPGTYDLAIPTCVSSVTFEIIGGGSAAGQGSAALAGARLTGTFALPSRGVTLRLVVGAAGTRSASGGVGGTGYGNGGSTPAQSRGGVGGGGGTAILIGTTPYTVAGGAGGAHVANWQSSSTGDGWGGEAVLTTTTNGVPFGSGAAGATPQNGNGRSLNYFVASTNTTNTRPGLGSPGRAASGATGGAGGTGQAYNANAPQIAFSSPVNGGNGGNHGTGNAGGGNGGAGSLVAVAEIQGVSGGGGGGYAGGGGGGGVGATATATNLRATLVTGGGAGSSYSGGSRIALTSQGAAPSGGNQGFIRISWT